MDSNGPRPPTFMKGYPNLSPQTYMNIGYRRSPYPGKVGQGDYGPSQGGHIFYTKNNLLTKDIYGYKNPWNPVYYTPLDFSPDVSKVAKLDAVYAQDIPLRNRK